MARGRRAWRRRRGDGPVRLAAPFSTRPPTSSSRYRAPRRRRFSSRYRRWTLRDISTATTRTGTAVGVPGSPGAPHSRSMALVAATPLDPDFTFLVPEGEKWKMRNGLFGPPPACLPPTDTPRYLDDDGRYRHSGGCSRTARSAASSWCTARRRGGAGFGFRKSLQGSCSSCHCYPVVASEQPTLRDISTTRASDGTGMRFYEMDGLGLPAGMRVVALGALLAKRTFRPSGPKNAKIEPGALGASPSVQARSRGRQAPGKRFAVPLPRSAAEVRSFESRSYPVAATHSPVSPPPR
ncbi:hypothetical protein PG987_006427 [Apiospora arundinis]